MPPHHGRPPRLDEDILTPTTTQVGLQEVMPSVSLEEIHGADRAGGSGIKGRGSDWGDQEAQGGWDRLRQGPGQDKPLAPEALPCTHPTASSGYRGYRVLTPLSDFLFPVRRCLSFGFAHFLHSPPPPKMTVLCPLLFLILRESGGGRKKGKHQLVASRAPPLGLLPTHVQGLGSEPATLQSAGLHAIH